MRAAPPVVHNLAGSGPWVWAAVALAALATTTPFIWLAWQLGARRMVDSFELGVLAVLGLLATALTVAWAGRRAGQHRGEQLRWDGGRWQLLDAKGHAWHLDMPAIELDLDAWVLLRIRYVLDGRTAWLPLQRSDAPRSWHGLRVALSQQLPREQPGPPAAGGVA
jgi:hypothetical protein